MKNLITLTTILFFCFNLFAQEVNMSQIEYYTADLTPEANYKKIERSGKYPGLVEYARKLLKYGHAESTRYSYSIPQLGDAVELDPSARRNERLKWNGRNYILLDPNNREHWVVYDSITGESFLLACLNKITRTLYFTIIDNSYTTSYQNKETIITETKEEVVSNNNWGQNLDLIKEAQVTKTPVHQNKNNYDFGLNKTKPRRNNCVEWYIEQYPDVFDRYVYDNRLNEHSLFWSKGYNLNAFDVLPGKERRALKKCLTGKTWVGRHLGIILPSGAAVLTGAYFLVKSLTDSNSDPSYNFGHEQDR